MIWINFIVSVLFGLEIAMKSYAFGLRRAFSQVHWVLKVEYFYQPLIWSLWLAYLFTSNENYKGYVNVFALGILLRSLRVSGLLNEIQLWRNFVRTISALVRPFFNFSVTLYSLFLIYASIGLEFFGGKVNVAEIDELTASHPDDVDDSWLYLNFNDYVMSLNTLFGIMW